mmetsp:Transcript_122616/g.329415  ORF Transcript_122616/g.329415 Transcript_122616/m.329415 type:complete len:373 (+) Transcript_122616:78-1196(+)
MGWSGLVGAFSKRAMVCAQSVALDASQARPQGKGRGKRRVVPLPDDLEPDAAAKPALGAREQFASEYELGNALGKGSFGIVMSARERSSRSMNAVKVVDSGEGQGWKRELAMQEVKVWRAVGRHSSIAELRRVFCDNRVVFMVMERCECTVAEKCDSNPRLLQSGLPDLLRQMLLGVEACHQARVAHRDVKPDNYLICPDGNTVKLCDFSSCALLPPNGSVAGEFGTAPFMSPEMLTAQHGLATDVYSYGVAAYFMLFGELPYIPERITSRAAKAATRAGVPAPRFLEPVPGDPSGSVGFCRGLLQRDPSQRCSAGDALGHSYFQVLFDAKKGPAMPDTQSTLDPFEAPALESDDLESDSEGTCTPRLSQVG